jgi:hypothetical protein
MKQTMQVNNHVKNWAVMRLVNERWLTNARFYSKSAAELYQTQVARLTGLAHTIIFEPGEAYEP